MIANGVHDGPQSADELRRPEIVVNHPCRYCGRYPPEAAPLRDTPHCLARLASPGQLAIFAIGPLQPVSWEPHDSPLMNSLLRLVFELRMLTVKKAELMCITERPPNGSARARLHIFAG